MLPRFLDPQTGVLREGGHPKTQEKEALGLIAGGGCFLSWWRTPQGQRIALVAVAQRAKTDPLLLEKVDEIAWIKLDSSAPPKVLRKPASPRP